MNNDAKILLILLDKLDRISNRTEHISNMLAENTHICADARDIILDRILDRLDKLEESIKEQKATVTPTMTELGHIPFTSDLVKI